MRKLNTADLFAFCRLVKALDARERLRDIAAAAAGRKEDGESVDLTGVGMDGMLALLEAAVEPRCEALVYAFLAGPLERTPDEVAALPLDELLPELNELAGLNDLSGFFASVSGILGKT